MAAPPLSFNPSTPHSAYRKQHHNQQCQNNLPAGRCNFRDLQAGPHALSCGCARFWSDEGKVGNHGKSMERNSGGGSISGVGNGVSGISTSANSKGMKRRRYHHHRCSTGGSDDSSYLNDSRPTLSTSSRGGEWCMCGHHACFHEDGSDRLDDANSVATASPLAAQRFVRQEDDKGFLGERLRTSPTNANGHPVYLQLISSRSDGCLGTSTGIQLVGAQRLSPGKGGNRNKDATTAPPVLDVSTDGDALPDTDAPCVSQVLKAEVRLPPATASTSTPSTSCLLPVPSQCLYVSNDLRRQVYTSDRSTPSREPRSREGKPDDVGLGLTLSREDRAANLINVGKGASAKNQVDLRVSDSPVILQSISSSNARSETEARNSPNTAFMRHALQPAQHVMNGIIPATRTAAGVPTATAARITTSPDANPVVPFEEAILSATEAATPSNANTPEVNAFDRTLDDAKPRVANLKRNMSAALEKLVKSNGLGRVPAAANTLTTDSRALFGMNDNIDNVHTNTNSPNLHPGSSVMAAHGCQLLSLQQTLKDSLPHIAALSHKLNEHPNLTTALKNVQERLDMLENTSFSHVPAEEIQERFDLADGRLIDLESRLEEQEKLHNGSDVAVDNSGSHLSNGQSTACSSKPKQVQQQQPSQNGNAPCLKDGPSFLSNTSFQSASSLHSATSSALISAAIQKVETDGLIAAIEQRLDDIEAEALPSFTKPWEIEVIFLPWGRDLKGVWFAPDDWPRNSCISSHSAALGDMKGTTAQDPADWSQVASSLRSSERIAKGPLSATTQRHGGSIAKDHSGWTSQDIHEWAVRTDQWYHPRACPAHGLVYRRLKSRGFVRNVSLTKPGAREIQAALVAAFGDGFLSQLHELSSSDIPASPLFQHSGDHYTHNGPLGTQPLANNYLGLEAPFIPLRKVHKSSRLLFLSRAEMVTSALWTAEFLGSGVLMRAAGGKKRLFITGRDGYLQERHPTDVKSSSISNRTRSRIHDSNLCNAAAGSAGWTWQRIREMSRVRIPVEGEQQRNEGHVAEADAREGCWEHHPGLDANVATHVSRSTSTSFHTCLPSGNVAATSLNMNMNKVHDNRNENSMSLNTGNNDDNMDYVTHQVPVAANSQMFQAEIRCPSLVAATGALQPHAQIQSTTASQRPLVHPITPLSEFLPDHASRNTDSIAIPAEQVRQNRQSQSIGTSKRAPSGSLMKANDTTEASLARLKVYQKNSTVAGAVAITNLRPLSKRRRTRYSSDLSPSIDESSNADQNNVNNNANSVSNSDMVDHANSIMPQHTYANADAVASVGASIDAAAIVSANTNAIIRPGICLTPRRSISGEQELRQEQCFEQQQQLQVQFWKQERQQPSPFLSSIAPSDNLPNGRERGDKYTSIGDVGETASSIAQNSAAGSSAGIPSLTHGAVAVTAAAGAYATPYSGTVVVTHSGDDAECDEDEENDEDDAGDEDVVVDDVSRHSDGEISHDYFSCQNQRQQKSDHGVVDEEVWEGVVDEDGSEDEREGDNNQLSKDAAGLGNGREKDDGAKIQNDNDASSAIIDDDFNFSDDNDEDDDDDEV